MKYIKHIWSVLCDSSVVDRETNNISLQKILEKLDVGIGTKPGAPQELPEKINIPFNFEIVTLWAREDFEDKKERKVDVKIETIDPKGHKLAEINNGFTMTSEFRRMRGRTKSANILLTSPGRYLFRISGREVPNGDYEMVSELPLEVEIKKEEIASKDVN